MSSLPLIKPSARTGEYWPATVNSDIGQFFAKDAYSFGQPIYFCSCQKP
jgi:hypothetical protein